MEARHQLEGVVVLGGDCIETSVVNTWAKTPLPLGDKEETCLRRGGGWANYTLLESLLDVLLHRFQPPTVF